MKALKMTLLAGVAALAFGAVAQAQTLTIATGGAAANSGGASTSNSSSAGLSAIAGVTAGTTSAAANNNGHADGAATATNEGRLVFRGAVPQLYPRRAA